MRKWMRTPRLPLSGPKIGFPLADYPARRWQQARTVGLLILDHQDPAELIKRLHAIQMGVSPASYTRLIDIMRVMSYGVAGHLRGRASKPLTVLDHDRRHAVSILGLVGSPHPQALAEQDARTTYFAAVLPTTPAALMEQLLAVPGHPRVWAAEFMAAATRFDIATIRDQLLIPCLLPQNEDLTKFRFLTLAMAEFACLWSGLWQGTQTRTPEELASVLEGLDLLCPAYHKRLFHEDISPEDRPQTAAANQQVS